MSRKRKERNREREKIRGCNEKCEKKGTSRANEGTDGKKIHQGEPTGVHVLSGRVFEIFPSYPSSLHGYCLRSLECAEGACIVRHPSYMHHPPIAILLRESTPSTLYLHSLFRVNPFVLALIFLQFLLRVYARTISHPFVYSRSTGGIDC